MEGGRRDSGNESREKEKHGDGIGRGVRQTTADHRFLLIILVSIQRKQLFKQSQRAGRDKIYAIVEFLLVIFRFSTLSRAL